MLAILETASATFGFCRKIYCWTRIDVRDDENVGSPRNVFQAKLKKKTKIRCFSWPVLQQFHKSLIIVKYHVAS